MRPKRAPRLAADRRQSQLSPPLFKAESPPSPLLYLSGEGTLASPSFHSRELFACPLYHPPPRFFVGIMQFHYFIEKHIWSEQQSKAASVETKEMVSLRRPDAEPSRGTRLFFMGNLALPNSAALARDGDERDEAERGREADAARRDGEGCQGPLRNQPQELQARCDSCR